MPDPEKPFTTVVNFGIRELDELFGQDREDGHAGMIAAGDESLTVGIVGADGTGKSVLALHLASSYAHKNAGVIYFSEDLGHKRASKVFENFGLGCPKAREKALDNKAGWLEALPEEEGLKLEEVSPEGLNLTTGGQSQIDFVDLGSGMAGDDWMLVMKTIAKMKQVEPGTKLKCVIIDNIDALQLVNAGVDQFGEERSRWSHLSQLMTLAKKRCHLILISGEPDPGKHIDEQYAADFILHLRTSEQASGHTIQTIEIEKARGQVNARGQHAYELRDGKRTTTGYQENPDCPEIAFGPNKTLSYMKVFHSLDYVYRKYIGKSWNGYRPGTGEHAAFEGLEDLNVLFPGDHIPGGTVSVLVGPRQTFKREFVSAFEAYHPSRIPPIPAMPENVRLRIAAAAKEAYDSDLQKRALHYLKYQQEARTELEAPRAEVVPVVVHLTTEDVDSWAIAARIHRIRNPEEKELSASQAERPWGELAEIESRVICRRLEINANSAPMLFSVIAECVGEGLRRAFPAGAETSNFNEIQRNAAAKVIVTLGDWALIEERYPDVAASSQFMPLLLFHLRRRGVTTLITESRTDTGAIPSVYQSRSRLAQIADQTIYTWRVPGDARIAIAVTPQKHADGRTLVREVKQLEDRPGLIEIDPSLERYEGFETGNPKPVRLHLRLMGQTPAQRLYAKAVGELLHQIAPGDLKDQPVVEEMEYELLRDTIFLQRATRQNYTQVVVVDEFWEARSSLHPLKMEYLEKKKDGRVREAIYNESFFQINNRPKPNTYDKEVKDPGIDPFCIANRADRVPFTWDFGLILTRPDAWRSAYLVDIPLPDTRREARSKSLPSENLPKFNVRTMAEMLRFARADRNQDIQGPSGFYTYSADSLRSSKKGPYGREDDKERIKNMDTARFNLDLLGWRVFLETCCYIADETTGLHLKPFDIDLTSPETLTATILEIWFSEFSFFVDRANPAGFQPEALAASLKLAASIGNASRSCSDPVLPLNLITLLENDVARSALFFALKLLAEVFDSEMLQATDTGFDIMPRRAFPAVAVRHWYSTAVHTAQDENLAGYTPIRLPGSFSTRGDWHLAITRGSKSLRLGYDTLDILSTVRANFDRMQMGVGLPTREMPDASYIRTALSAEPRSSRSPGISYQNLTLLGATDGDPSFHWLFRSRIQDYRLQTTVFRKVMFRVLQDFVRIRHSKIGARKSAFELYDAFVQKGASVLTVRSEGQEKTEYEAFLDDHLPNLVSLLNKIPHDPGGARAE